MPHCSITKIPVPRIALGMLMVGAVDFAAAIGRHPVFTAMGLTLCLAAMILYAMWRVITEVRTVNRPADEAFTEGWEAGYDKGWRDGNADAKPALTVLPGLLAQPDFAGKCGDTPHASANGASHG